MIHSKYLKQIDEVEKIANVSKLRRLLFNPGKYIYAIFFRKFIYPINKQEKITKANLFYNKVMEIALPAATDIYLTGGKSHISEIRLAKFIIINLEQGQHFLDIGAHYGYFTLLAAEILQKSGKIMSFEPATRSFDILKKNTAVADNIHIFQQAMSDSTAPLVFFEFSNLHSEYNSADVTQFEQEEWYKNAPPKKVEVSATTIDTITKNGMFLPNIIKIDVEGGEYKVIEGGLTYFKNHSPLIVMEYLAPARQNTTHKQALNLLKSIGYQSFLIDNSGQLNAIDDIDAYLVQENLESDNVVFKK